MDWKGKLSQGPDGVPIMELTNQRSGITYHTWADALRAEANHKAWEKAWETMMLTETG